MRLDSDGKNGHVAMWPCGHVAVYMAVQAVRKVVSPRANKCPLASVIPHLCAQRQLQVTHLPDLTTMISVESPSLRADGHG